MEYINIRLKDMPGKVKALSTVNEDGGYTIFVNAHLSNDAQHSAVAHEIRHINNDDFYRDESVNIIEMNVRMGKYND